MPIYEFYSPDTNRIYSFFARTVAHGGQIPRCPDRPGARMERMVSRFAVTGRAREESNSPDPMAMPDENLQRAMAEMEREMAGMSDENPDPRQVGHLMRKLTEVAGRRLPAGMEEMIQRLEQGEDPEKLEEEFGDSLEGFEDEFGEESTRAAGLRKRRSGPSRDPKLYEMGEYL
jgi:hypothetical protein